MLINRRPAVVAAKMRVVSRLGEHLPGNLRVQVLNTVHEFVYTRVGVQVCIPFEAGIKKTAL